jgi:hypothetical protein
VRRVLVRYKVLADRAGDNERYIRAVFAQLARDRPAGLRYASFKAADGVTFVHVASVETPDGVNPLLAVSAFGEFTANIKDRCAEPPVTLELTEIGDYELLGRTSTGS